MSNVRKRTNEIVTVRGRQFDVECIEWKDSDGLSFDVSDVITGQALHNESFDDDPGVEGVEQLLDQLAEDLENDDVDDFFSDDEKAVIADIVAITKPPTITISLRIMNRYELYPDEITVKTDEVIPAPPADRGSRAFGDWAQEYIYDFTGVGHEDGDSWYDVTVTACSDPTLVNHEFEFGY